MEWVKQDRKQFLALYRQAIKWSLLKDRYLVKETTHQETIKLLKVISTLFKFRMKGMQLCFKIDTIQIQQSYQMGRLNMSSVKIQISGLMDCCTKNCDNLIVAKLNFVLHVIVYFYNY